MALGDIRTVWDQAWPSLSERLCKLAAHFSRDLISIDDLDFLSEISGTFRGQGERHDLQENMGDEAVYAQVISEFRHDLSDLTAFSGCPVLSRSEEAVCLLFFAQALTLVSKRSGRESPTNQILVRACTDVLLGDDSYTPLSDVIVVEAAVSVAPNESVPLAAEIGRRYPDRRRDVAEVAAYTGWTAAVPLLQEWARSAMEDSSSLLLVCAARAGAGTSQDNELTREALQSVKQGPGAELNSLADWVVDRSQYHDDQAVREILHLLKDKFPAGFNPLNMTFSADARIVECGERRHWPVQIRMDLEESPWPAWSRFLSGAACAAGLPDYAFALACHEYLHWEDQEFGLSSTTGVAGPLLVLAMTAGSADIREGCLNRLRDLLMGRVEISSPSLRLSRSYVAARHYSGLGNMLAARTAIKEAVLLVSGPIRTTTGWHGLPVAGYEIFDSRLRPEIDDVWSLARDLDVDPKDLTNTPAQRVRTMLELARESLAPEGTARPDYWVAKALLLTAEEALNPDVISAWAGSTALLDLSALYMHEHPLEHDGLRLWHALSVFLDRAGATDYGIVFSSRISATQQVIRDVLRVPGPVSRPPG